ncbi:MAG: dCMP deaminase family protein [Planctomycetota bacterium]
MSEFYTPPHRDEYFMGIAMAVRERANCRGRRVGAIAVLDNRIISTGYNGTPYGMTNCLDGGCRRCAHPEQFASGTGYDLCICVHAEQNALLAAARFGIALDGSTVYSTLRPCFGCTKEMLQAKVQKVVYLHDWIHPDTEIHEEYSLIQGQFSDGIQHLEIEDSRSDWANGRSRA